MDNLEVFKMITKHRINEQVGLDDFLEKISIQYPDSVYIMEFIVDFIKKSGCQKIELTNFQPNIPAYGASLHDRVLLNEMMFKSKVSLTYFLYVLFHEIAHQYQYKKYGIDKMYGIYTGEISIEDGAKWVQNCENIADEFAIRKLRELKKKNKRVVIFDQNITKAYKNAPIDHFKNFIENIVEMLKKGNYKNKIDITEIMYNNIKLELK